MQKNTTVQRRKLLALTVASVLALPGAMIVSEAEAKIAATHIYHNHMPNFWPYYDTSSYATTPVGGPIRYTYDGQAYNLKLSPPANYTYFLANGKPMPHDDFDAYYNHNAKQNAYSSWPAATARANNGSHPLSQTQVTMSASVINNLQSFAELGILGFKTGWANDWKSTVGSVKTTNGFNALEPIHFTGHHSMGPLVGPDYFLKDLIYQNVTLQQDYFLGDKFRSSKGFFPTELGFSERLIPTLRKLGIEWSVAGNNHFSRTLLDYPFLDYPAKDTMVSPPNRADLQNTFEAGEWVTVGMSHEQQNVVNKYPFCIIPHWVQYVDPETGKIDKLAAIPVDQNGSWLEGWEGYADATNEVDRTTYVDAAGDRVMYFVIAHDGDNSQGRAGSYDTWMNSGKEYSINGVVGMGVQEYLKAHPIPEDDIQHIQDGSWIDTRDSSSDPDWYHWHIPMGVWKGQFADFSKATGTEFEYPKNHADVPFGHAVSLEYGYHYLERNFAILQASLNYAKTAEQIWLDDHPNYWSPKTEAEKQVTYEGNQLNPYMLSYPVKGDEANDYKGGANPAELGWYFLIASIDSGFGYYDENTDDNVKPTLGFNQSLFFTEPYVQKNLAKDKTGPSMWWVQRYPTNPGSVNSGKAEGWTTIYADNTWAIYTYAFDASGIEDVKVYIRPHKAKRMGPTDIAPRVYDPSKFAGQPNVDVDQVGEWKAYPTKMRNLEADINGVGWQTAAPHLLYNVLGAKKIGNTYYAYINEYRDQLVDYYMEATDKLGNVTRSEIQHTYVGAGRYKSEGGLIVEDVNGDMEGTHVFFTDGNAALMDKVTVFAKVADSSIGQVYADYKDQGAEGWGSQSMTKVQNSDYFKTTVYYSREAGCADIRVHAAGDDKYSPSESGKCLSKGTYTIGTDGTISEGAPTDIEQIAKVYFKPSSAVSKACIHYRPLPATEDGWTEVPGAEMSVFKDGWFNIDLKFKGEVTGIEYLFNDCGGNWFKNETNGNFTINSIADFCVDGNKVKSDCEFIETPVVNKSPVADILASSVEIVKGESVTLDGSSSIDPDGTVKTYKWSTDETTPKITVSPTETTTYTLTVTDDKGAMSSKSVTIKVVSEKQNMSPVANIEASALEIIKGESVTLDGSSSKDSDGSIASYKWSSGETTASITVSPTSTTTYTLTVTDDKGAKATKTVTIHVVSVTGNKSPVANVVASALKIKKGDSVTLDASTSKDSDGSIASYKWSNNETTAKITVTPTETTTYTVTVTDDKGASATKSVTVEVVEDAIVVNPLFTVKIDEKSVVFTNSSTVSGAEDVTYNWDFGDGSTSTDKNPVHTYATEGTYKVVLRVKAGDVEETISSTIVIEGAAIPLEAKIVASSDSVGVGEKVILDASASTGKDITFAWNTGETTSKIEVYPQATTVYKVTVTDSDGKKASMEVTVTVVGTDNNAPVAKLVTNIAGNVVKPGTEVKLDASSSADPDGDELNFVWSTGEAGPSSIVVNVEETTTFTVKVTDTEGASSKASITINVASDDNMAPVAVLSPNQTITLTEGEQFTISAEESYDDKAIELFTWSINGEVVQSGHATTIQGIADTVGEFNVVVTVKDAEGLESSAQVKLIVKSKVDEYVITPVIEADRYVDVGEQFTISGLRSQASLGIKNYTWTIAGESLAQNTGLFVYSFNKPGSFVITLMVEDKEGHKKYQSITVYASETIVNVDLPKIEVGSQKVDITTDEGSVQVLENKVNVPVDVKISNLVGRKVIRVYAKVKSQLQANSSSDTLKLCRIIDNVVDCNATYGEDRIVVDSDAVSLQYAQEGEYQMHVEGNLASNGNYYAGVVPVEVKPETSAPEYTGGVEGESGGSGGSVDLFSLLGLGLGALAMRRRKNK